MHFEIARLVAQDNGALEQFSQLLLALYIHLRLNLSQCEAAVTSLHLPAHCHTAIQIRAVSLIRAGYLANGWQSPVIADFLVLKGVVDDEDQVGDGLQVECVEKREAIHDESLIGLRELQK